MKKSTTFQGKPKPFGKGGHFYEPRRHALQAKGIKTGNLSRAQKGMLYRLQLPKVSSVLARDRDIMTAEALKRKGFVTLEDDEKVWKAGARYRVKLKDTDKDNVPDYLDCEPLNPKKHGNFVKKIKKKVQEEVGLDKVDIYVTKGWYEYILDEKLPKKYERLREGDLIKITTKPKTTLGASIFTNYYITKMRKGNIIKDKIRYKPALESKINPEIIRKERKKFLRTHDWVSK